MDGILYLFDRLHHAPPLAVNVNDGVDPVSYMLTQGMGRLEDTDMVDRRRQLFTVRRVQDREASRYGDPCTHKLLFRAWLSGTGDVQEVPSAFSS